MFPWNIHTGKHHGNVRHCLNFELLTNDIVAHEFQYFIYINIFDYVPETFNHILNTFLAHTLKFEWECVDLGIFVCVLVCVWFNELQIVN